MYFPIYKIVYVEPLRLQDKYMTLHIQKNLHLGHCDLHAPALCNPIGSYVNPDDYLYHKE